MTFVYDEDGVYCALIDQNYQRKIPDLVNLPHFMIMGSANPTLNFFCNYGVANSPVLNTIDPIGTLVVCPIQ